MPEKALIYFLHANGRGYDVRSCDDGDIEGEIRYWLGKSPGINEMAEILVIPESQKVDRIDIVQKIRDEEDAFTEKMRESEERAEFERLSKKFNSKL